jgi:hypothetical protein
MITDEEVARRMKFSDGGRRLEEKVVSWQSSVNSLPTTD